jgi:uncharacterized protein YkwD
MWFVVACVGVALMTGCRGGAVIAPRVTPETVLHAEPLAAPVTVAVAHAAAAYSEPIGASPDASLSEAVRAAMQEVAGSRAEIAGDPRLDIACRELAAVTSRDGPPSATVVDFVMSSLGIVERAERVLVAWDVAAPDDVVAALRPQLGDALAGYLRVGAGTAANGAVIAIAVRSTGVVFAPVPRAVASGEGFELVATLEPRLDDPRVIIVRDDGTRETRPVVRDDERQFRARFECGERTGRQWIEVDADGPGGRLPRAQLPILCGSQPPSSFTLEPASNLSGLATAADMERRLTSIINRERARGGLAQLPTDLRVARSAREYAEAVRDRVAESEPAAQSPTERLRASGIRPRFLVENFLEVDSLGQAAEELMNQAVYRERLESEAVSDVGVGIAIDEDSRRLWITITYVRLPRPIEPAAVARRLTDAVNALEESETNLDLANAAQHFASELAVGWRREHVWPRIQGELDMIDRRFVKVGHAIVSTLDAAKLEARELVRGRPADEIGVGVAQSARYGSQGGVVWVVVFLAVRPRGTFAHR